MLKNKYYKISILFVIKLVLGFIALFLAITRGKKDKELLFYWLIVAAYWFINALS